MCVCFGCLVLWYYTVVCCDILRCIAYCVSDIIDMWQVHNTTLILIPVPTTQCHTYTPVPTTQYHTFILIPVPTTQYYTYTYTSTNYMIPHLYSCIPVTTTQLELGNILLHHQYHIAEACNNWYCIVGTGINVVSCI